MSTWAEPALLTALAAAAAGLGILRSPRVPPAAEPLQPSHDASPLLDAWLDALDVAICAVDAEDRLVAWNLLWTRWFPVQLPEDASGLDVVVVIEGLPGIDSTNKRQLRQAFTQGTNRSNPVRVRVGHRHLQGTVRQISRGLWMWTFRDVTAEVDAIATAERVRSELDAFVYGATHDLRRPLAEAQGLLAEARSVVENQELDEVFEDLAHRIAEADRMLGALVDMASGPRLGPAVRPVDLDQLVDEAMEEFQHVARTGAMHVVREFEVPVLWADPLRLRQVLVLALENADRHRGAQAELVHVTLSTRAVSAGVEFRIADDGPGLPEDLRERAFELFARGHDTMGAGLGLYRVRRLVEEMDGSVRLGRGAGFSLVVTLPVPLSPL